MSYLTNSKCVCVLWILFRTIHILRPKLHLNTGAIANAHSKYRKTCANSNNPFSDV